MTSFTKTASLGVAAVLLCASPALAQGNLMDLGKDMVRKELGPRTGTTSPAGGSGSSALSTSEIGSGLKEALRVAADKVTSRLGKADGFNTDPSVHIPLPDKLATAKQALALAGKSQMVDDLELKLNRAAEAATPKAKQIFWDAVQKMTLDDARGILNGPQDAATQYFKRTMSPDLRTAMRPVVDSTVSQSGAVQSYSSMAGAAQGLPMVSDALKSGPAMLTDHVLDYALSGIFKYLGQEEAAIRTNPASRSTDLLKKVFGG
jgi:hypothetical protein